LVIGRLPIGRAGLRCGRGGDAGLNQVGRGGGLSAGGRRGATLQRPQTVFELAVAVLQLLVLAGELPQLVLELLNAHFRIRILRKGPGGQGLRRQHQHRGDRRGAGSFMKSG
jgi:hypothetical protein